MQPLRSPYEISPYSLKAAQKNAIVIVDFPEIISKMFYKIPRSNVTPSVTPRDLLETCVEGLRESRAISFIQK